MKKQNPLKPNKMRIKISFSSNTEPVPNNLSVVNSYIHNCLGRNNEIHDKESDYNIGRLYGGVLIDNGKNIDYPNGGYLLISSLKQDFLNDLIIKILENQSLGYGMEFNGIDYIRENFFNGWNNFKTTDMGFMLRKPKDTIYDDDDKHKGYYTLNDNDLVTVLKNQIIRKFSAIDPNYDLENLEVVIPNHPNHKIAYRYSKHIKNSVNICQININTNKIVAEALYNYGLGQSCGSGFGTIYTTQFIDIYK
jgi:CRISPR-associated endoribonuclease Cas6